MLLHFSKYHGAGNDFIVFDNRVNDIILTPEQRSQLCHRRFGIGADGILEIQKSEVADFRLLYYNSNGNESSLCGNGCRCALAYARYISVKFEDDENISFEAYDGVYFGAFISGIDSVGGRGMYSIGFADIPVDKVKRYNDEEYFVDTGSPHHVIFVEGKLDDCDVIARGRDKRYNFYGKDGGCNINFVTFMDNNIVSTKDMPPSRSRVDSTIKQAKIDRLETLSCKIKNLNRLEECIGYTDELQTHEGCVEKKVEPQRSEASIEKKDDLQKQERYIGKKDESQRHEACFKQINEPQRGEGCIKKKEESFRREGCIETNDSHQSHEGFSVKTDNHQRRAGRIEKTDEPQRTLSARTYERGVEDETLACGTGAVGIAIVDFVRSFSGLVSPPSALRTPFHGDVAGQRVSTDVRMPGGILNVSFVVKQDARLTSEQSSFLVFGDVTLSGPVQHVFDGVYMI